MATKSNIQWTDSTFNPWIGCTKISPACDNCYAERDFDHRLHVVVWSAGQPRKRTSVQNWNQPLRWNKLPFSECTQCGYRTDLRTAHCPDCNAWEPWRAARRRVFCASLADVFDNEVPDSWRADLFDLIWQTPHLDWLLLTKRIGNAERMIARALELAGRGINTPWPWPNVWIGATICGQDEAERDIPKLLSVPARVRFLSIEPMLGPISFEGMFANPSNPADGTNMLEELDWVIVGGESGPDARPMHPDWVRSLREQCQATDVPFLFKQWGEWAPGECSDHTLEWRTVKTADLIGDRWEIQTIRGDAEFFRDEEPALYRAGKKAAGRMLDGVEHTAFPRGAA